MNQERKTITRYVVETDLLDHGEYASLRDAIAHAKPEDFILELTYREIRSRIIKIPDPKITPEIKRSDWLSLYGKGGKHFCIDVGDLELSPEEMRNPLMYKEKIYARYSGHIPFKDVEDITSLTLNRKKFGARVTGNINETTEWTIFNTKMEAINFLLKTHNVRMDNNGGLTTSEKNC